MNGQRTFFSFKFSVNSNCPTVVWSFSVTLVGVETRDLEGGGALRALWRPILETWLSALTDSLPSLSMNEEISCWTWKKLLCDHYISENRAIKDSLKVNKQTWKARRLFIASDGWWWRGPGNAVITPTNKSTQKNCSLRTHIVNIFCGEPINPPLLLAIILNIVILKLTSYSKSSPSDLDETSPKWNEVSVFFTCNYNSWTRNVENLQNIAVRQRKRQYLKDYPSQQLRTQLLKIC